MYLCESCKKPDDELYSALMSYGKCETCREVKVCFDVDIHSKPKESKRLRQ
jgi:hypothetical protein